MPELTTFASREPASYISGTVLPAGVTNHRDLLAAVDGLDWDVRLRPLETDARTDKVDFEVIRTNPLDQGIDRLGIAGERYGTAQNESVFRMFDDLSPEWNSVGVFRGGRLVWGQAETGQSIVIDPNGAADEVKNLVTVSTTHDSSGALRIGRTGRRINCMNEFNAVMRGLTHKISIRHTLTIEDRMKQVRLAWKQNNAYFEAVKAEAEALHAKNVTNKAFFGIVESLIGERPEENKKGAQTKWENRRELFAAAWNGKPNENIRGTGWGAWQALLEANQWGRTIQQTPNGLENFAMAGMGFDEPTNTFRQRSLEAVQAL